MNLTNNDEIPTNMNVPVGHLLTNIKWSNSDLVSRLNTLLKVSYDEYLGIVDFCPANDAVVMFVSENDILADKIYRRKIAQLARNFGNLRKIVIVEKTSKTVNEVASLQKFIVIELGLIVVVVSGCEEAAKFLSSMVSIEAQSNQNPFKNKRKVRSVDVSLINSIRGIPSLGEKKAQQLLIKFKSIQGICNASVDELSSVVGFKIADNVHRFFNNNHSTDN